MPKDKGSGRGYSSTPLSPRLHRAAPDHLRGPRFQVSDAASRPSRFGRLRARRPSSELETVKRQEGRKRQPLGADHRGPPHSQLHEAGQDLSRAFRGR